MVTSCNAMAQTPVAPYPYYQSADYFFASPNAISTSGSLVIADYGGTKTAGVGPSGNLVLLAGSNKIVDGGQAEALERLMAYAVPMESLRAHLAYGIPESKAMNVGRWT